MSIQLAPLHIPAIRPGPGFETDTSAAVKRHQAAHWGYADEGFHQIPNYASTGCYDRKHIFPYPYPDPQYSQLCWPNYRTDQNAAAAAYMNDAERHVSAAARQSVEGTSTSSYEPPTYASPGGLRGYSSENYPSSVH